jgi:peptide/nickel transport system substrate-binding protein
VPSGPWYEALRTGNFDVAVEAPGHGVVNPLLDIQKELSASASAENYAGYEDPAALQLYDRLLREPDPVKQQALIYEFEKHNLDTEAHQPYLVWWSRIVPHHSYVKGWRIGPSHLANQDLATVWLDK